MSAAAYFNLFLAFLVAALLSFVLTPPVKTLAGRIGAVDVPKDARRMHHVPIPRLGGLAIFLAFLLTTLLFCEITAELLERFESGELQKIYVIYTDMESSLLSEAKSTRLLPFHRMQFAPPAKEKAVQEPFEFYPSVGAVLNSMIPSYVSGFLYSALLDSFCSEQNARMTAMDAANQNAEELLSALRLQYNRVRQAAITQEITEISAGAAAQRGTFGSEG